MKRNPSSRRLKFHYLKTNTMKTDAKIRHFMQSVLMFQKKVVIFSHFLNIFCICKYILIEQEGISGERKDVKNIKPFPQSQD